MRATLITLCLFLVGCGGAKPEPTLEGVWKFEGTEPDGTRFESLSTISEDGSYTCQFSVSDNQGTLTLSGAIEGKMVIEDGYLIDTMLKHSNTDAELPSITRARIVRFDETQLTVAVPEEQEHYGTNRIVTLRRVKN